MAPVHQEQVIGRILRNLGLLIPIVLWLPPILLGGMLRNYAHLPQSLKSAVLYVVEVEEPVLVPLAPVLGLIAWALGLAIFAGWLALMSEFRLLASFSRLIDICDTLGGAIRDLMRPGQANADLAALRQRIEQDVRRISARQSSACKANGDLLSGSSAPSYSVQSRSSPR